MRIDREGADLGGDRIDDGHEERGGAGNFRHGKFDVAFLDYQMAFPDGLTLARQMRASGSNRLTPIVLVSDDQRPAAMATGFEAGAGIFFFQAVLRRELFRLVRGQPGGLPDAPL